MRACCRMFCQATGYGGTVQQGEAVEAKLKKQVRVERSTATHHSSFTSSCSAG